MQSTTANIKAIVQRSKDNRPQQDIRIPKKATIKAIKLNILRVKELIV